MPQPLIGHGNEPMIGRNAHDRLGDRERDDLRITDPAPRVPGPPGHEIVGQTINNREQQIEVGVHSRPPSGRRLALQSTADFDLPAYDSFNAPSAVALLI